MFSPPASLPAAAPAAAASPPKKGYSGKAFTLDEKKDAGTLLQKIEDKADVYTVVLDAFTNFPLIPDSKKVTNNAKLIADSLQSTVCDG
jgi:hypothetical protein